ncbi:MAG: hypothetical protein IT196_05355 [Acidimicrobiales bacterium]|nr:hypothetical protein [Acidimicrobiales bacterium]
MSTAILVPFASTDPLRIANLEAVQRWYADRFPGVEQIVADDGGCREGWTKARAVQRCIDQTDADVLVVADSDCLCEGVVPAVAAVEAGEALWAFPHTQIRRLDPEPSQAVRDGAEPTLDMPLEWKAYAGVAGGGIVVLTRKAWELAPLDPRFRVTHGEDVAWARALGFLCGRPWYPARTVSPLYHLHHPPILAVGARYKANERIAAEYRNATSLTIGAVLDRARATVDMAPVAKLPTSSAVAVIVPVLRRPAAAAPFMASWAVTGGPMNSAVYAVTDAEDTDTRRAWYEAGATVLTSDRGSTYAAKVNYALEATSEPWLLLLGDDVRFHDGWLPAALDAGRRAPVVSTNDMGRTDLDRLAVHPMFARAYLEQRGASFDGPGLIAHEGYKHWYVDREWSLLALDRGAMTFAENARIEHLHPIHRKGEMDEVYALGQAAAEDDARLYRMRERQYVKRIRRSTDA